MRRTLPSFISPPSAAARATGGRRDWHGTAIIGGLLLLLLMQIVLADRVQLAADARWRPLVSGACAVLRCEVPAWREPGAMTLVDRDVRPHPSHAGALRVKATFRNEAQWAQAWPVLVLTLSDVDGRVVGARAFQPREYLGREPARATIASNEAAAVSMDILEPMPGVVAFTFDFR